MLPAEAIILCGGKGTRLRAVVADRPKPLAEIGGRPFVEYVIDQLRQYDVNRIIISAGYMADVIEHYFSSARHGCTITVVTEKQPLGTAGAVRLALKQVSGDRFWVANGDSFCGADLRCAARVSGADALLVAARIEDAAEYGSVSIGPDGHVTRFSEKNGIHAPGIVNAGIYLFDRERIATFLPEPGAAGSLERDVLPKLQKLAAYVTDAPLIDIGTQERFDYAQKIIRKGLIK